MIALQSLFKEYSIVFKLATPFMYMYLLSCAIARIFDLRFNMKLQNEKLSGFRPFLAKM